jgi:CheY-like chemotaxis protein
MDRKKILVVDDNQIILRTLALKLRNDYDVLTAADGGEAVSTVRKSRPDLILLDITFPPDVAHGGGVPWDGFRIIEWLRRIDEAKNTPVFIISGGEPAKYKDRALAQGALAFFQKPINHEELRAAIRQTLNADAAPALAPEI